MKKLFLFACSLFLTVTVSAADLTIELPKAEWLLQPVSPPQLQKEGLFSPPEQAVAGRLMPLITQGLFDQALLLFREEYPEATANIEQRNVYSPATDLDFNRVSSAMLYMMGHTYFNLEQYDPAETAFRSALSFVPDYIRVHESLGFVYLVTGRHDEARIHLARAASLGLNTANLYGSLGYLNQETNNFWGAVSAYQQAMMLEPDNPQWQQGLLYSLTQTSQYDSALTLIDQLLQENEDEPRLWVFRGHMAQQTGDPLTALSSLETAIRLGDDSLGNLQVASSLHMNVGSIERAVDLLNDGFRDGMDFTFYNQALVWLARNEEWDSFDRLLDSASSRRDSLTTSEQSLLLTRQASLSTHNGDTGTARSRLQQAIELDGTNTLAQMDLADNYRDSNNYNQAELLYQRASADSMHRTNALMSMAQLAIDQDNFSSALDLLREVMIVNPDRTDIRRNIEILESLVLASNEN